MPKVYLAGPIADISYKEATDWRAMAHRGLAIFNVEAVSPMRDHEHLTGTQRLSKNIHDEDGQIPTRTRKGIMSRDFYDVRSCDAVLVNLLGAKRVSIGTVMEIAWAFQNRTPIVAVMERDESNIHEHGMLNEAVDFRVGSLRDGIDTIASVLNIDAKREMAYQRLIGNSGVKLWS